MQLLAEKLNKMTVIKAVASLIAIIAVIAVSFFAVQTFAENGAQTAALNAYTSWAENLSRGVGENLEASGYDLSTIGEEEARSLFSKGYNGFEGVALAADTGRVVYPSSQSQSRLGDYNIGFSPQSVLVSLVNRGEKCYAVAVAPIGEAGYAIGYIDFTATAAQLARIRTLTIALGITSAVVSIAAYVVFIITTGLNERGHKYAYKFVTDLEGRILRSNAAFKQDFPQTVRIFDNVAHFHEEKLNAIKLGSGEDEVFIACAAKKTASGKVKISADRLAMPYNAQATQPREMMREAYTSFLPHGKPFLIGNIFFADLHNIKDMFGREFAEQVHKILYDKISERFSYLYELNLYNIGVLYPDGKKLETLMQDLKDIVNSLNESLKIENNIVNISVKCGFAVCDNSMEQRGFEYAMTAADAALRRATQDKLKNYYVFHGSEIKQYAKYFFNYDIRQMLEDNMFELEYQPQYGVKENRVVGFEALFRVKKSANVFVNIFDLISYAERSGNMVLLGDFIFNTAMDFAKRVEDKNVTVSVNVSPVQLMQAGFCENFLNLYESHEIKTGVLCVEITESFLVQNFDDAVKKLEVLRQHGIEVHLDDFGTRYSSLLYLKKLPVQVIKIDREFIMDINENDYDRSITEMVIGICKKHNMTSISEGVETREQFDTLKQLGIDVVQGYLIGKSMPADAAFKMIDEFRLK